MDRGDRSLTEIGQVTKTRLHWTPCAFLSTVWSMAPSGEVSTGQPLLMQRTCDSVKSKSNLIYEKLELLGSAISVSMELDNLS